MNSRQDNGGKSFGPYLLDCQVFRTNTFYLELRCRRPRR